VMHEMSYRSSWLRLEWTVMQGNEHSRKSLSSSTARATDLTKMTTWAVRIRGPLVNGGVKKGSHLVEVKSVQQVIELAVLL